jgi:RimJ/RimL family protein N-acetyltransferase
VIEGDGVGLRRAEPDDVDFLVQLLTDADVAPFLARVTTGDREEVLAEVERSQTEPDEFGRFVIEVEDDGGWSRAGLVGFELRNRRSRIAHLRQLAVHPDFRGRRVADAAARLFQRHLIFDLGFHRLELEVYGFNERAIVHAERSGFVREGTKRRAYLYEGEWVDGVLFGLTREDLE